MKLVLASLLVAVSFAAGSAAHGCTFNTREPEVTAAGYYVDNDVCQLDRDVGCLASLWVYQESNGIEGLQRGDEFIDDTCGGEIEPDTLVARVRA